MPVTANTNGQLQAYRLTQNKTSLIYKLNALIAEYAASEGTDTDAAIRDVLTDLRHICDINQLDFGEIDGNAYEGYLDELSWRDEEDVTS